MNKPASTQSFATTLPVLELNPALDTDRIRHDYLRHGHTRIDHILSEGAREIFMSFCQNDEWIQLIYKPGKVMELSYQHWCDMEGTNKRRKIEAAMYDRAIDEFQYSYAALRVPDEAERNAASNVMVAIATFMESPAVVTFLEQVTGVKSPVFGDGQATAYGHGDFLTGHDDNLAGRARTAACVFGFTPQWRPEWGGLLLFHELGSTSVRGLAPQFNTLDLFSVPRYHSVSQITRAAPRRRFAVTGWISPGA